MTKPSITIRPARFPEDDALCAGFIDGLQLFEHAIEPNRRIDPSVGREFLETLKTRMGERNGIAWIAEQGGEPAGWALCYEEDEEIYVVPEARRYLTVQELFVVERCRGMGVGRALLAQAEAEARARGLSRMGIGLLAGNHAAHAAYTAFGFRDASRWMIKTL
jgi:GNAT superfamily N-acetyltransferase